MKKSLVRFILIPLMVSLIVLSLIYAGALHYLDRLAQDSLYQANGIPSKDIVIIGIDNSTTAMELARLFFIKESITVVSNKSGSPTKVLFRDRFIQLCVLGWIVAFLLIIYF